MEEYESGFYPITCGLSRPLFFLSDGRVLNNCGSSVSIYDSRNPEIHSCTDYIVIQAATYIRG